MKIMLLIRKVRQVVRACSQYLSAGSWSEIKTKSKSLFPKMFVSRATEAYYQQDEMNARRGRVILHCNSLYLVTAAPALPPHRKGEVVGPQL